MRQRPSHWRTLLGTYGLAAFLTVVCGVSAQDVEPHTLISFSTPSEDGHVDYGPVREVPRKTLLQWSYGTSFGGGPDLDKPLQTDRPDFTETSSTVGRGVGQIEFGYTYFHDQDENRSRSVHSIGEPLLRYGIGFDWLEFRVATNYLSESRRENVTTGRECGFADLYLGFKIGLTPQEGILPEIAVTPQILLPTGSPPFTGAVITTPGPDESLSTHYVAPGVNFLYSWDLNKYFSLGASTQFNRTDDEETGRTYTEFAQSCVLHWTVTERFDVFGEWYALLPIGADSVLPEQYLSSGAILYLTNNLQLDVRAGAGLTSTSANSFVGAGGAVRF